MQTIESLTDRVAILANFCNRALTVVAAPLENGGFARPRA